MPLGTVLDVDYYLDAPAAYDWVGTDGTRRDYEWFAGVATLLNLPDGVLVVDLSDVTADEDLAVSASVGLLNLVAGGEPLDTPSAVDLDEMLVHYRVETLDAAGHREVHSLSAPGGAWSWVRDHTDDRPDPGPVAPDRADDWDHDPRTASHRAGR